MERLNLLTLNYQISKMKEKVTTYLSTLITVLTLQSDWKNKFKVRYNNFLSMRNAFHR